MLSHANMPLEFYSKIYIYNTQHQTLSSLPRQTLFCTDKEVASLETEGDVTTE